MNEQYLIIHDYEESYFYTKNAVSFKDCLIQFLDHINENNPLIIKALNGMDTEEEMVNLINAMVSYDQIDTVYKVDKILYDAK